MQRPLPPPWRAAVVSGALLVAGLTVVGVSLAWLGEEADRQAEEWAEDQAELVRRTAEEVTAELTDVADDVDLVVSLLRALGPEAARVSVEAVIRSATASRAAVVVDEKGEVLLLAVDPRAGGQLRDDVAAALLQTARLSLSSADGDLRTSQLIATEHQWFRAFGERVPGVGAAALLVDTRPAVSVLRALTAGGATRTMLLGPQGRPLPDSDPVLVALAEAGGVPPLLAAAKTRGGLCEVVAGPAARGLGLPPVASVVCSTAVTPEAGLSWTLVAVSPLPDRVALVGGAMGRIAATAVALLVLLATLGVSFAAGAARARRAREQLEAAAREAALHAQSRRVLEAIPTGVLVLSEELRVTGANGAIRTRVPRAEEATLREVFPHLEDAELESLTDFLEACRREGAQSRLSVRLPLFGPRRDKVSLHARRFSDSSPGEAFLLVVEDLSAIDQLEAQLVRREKLSTVGVLAAGVAHEVGTPLGVVRGRAELLTKALEGSPEAKHAEVIIRQIDRTSRTIRALLGYARERPTVSAAQADVCAVAKEVRDLLRYELEKTGVGLLLDLPDAGPAATTPQDTSGKVALPLQVAASSDEIEQVLVNLILNARDASPPGSQVVVRARRSSPRAVLLDVIDRGVGIPEEARSTIFDPFFTTKRRGQGTGLGLCVVQQIVQSRQGQIEVESAVGQGTTMRVSWPLAAEGSA